MKALPVIFLFLCLFFLPLTTSAEVKTFSHTIKQPFSGSQSPDDARIAAIEKAKREVLEKAGTYLESLKIVEKGRLKKDHVLALASGVLKTEIVSQKNYHTEEGFGIIIESKVTVDTSVIEERIKKLLKDKDLLSKYEESQQRVAELLAKVEALEEQNRKPLSKEAKEDLKSEFRETSQKLTATELNEKALALWNHGFYTDVDKAIGYLEQAILLDQDFSAAYNNLGLAYDSKGDYDKAIEYYQKSLKIGLKKLGSEHPDVATSYNNLGKAYESKGDYGKAIEYCQKALKIDLKKLGPEHPKVAGDYNSLGLIYKRRGGYGKAIEYYQKALKIDLKKIGPEYPGVAKLYNNLGAVYSRKGDYDKAIEYYQKSLKIDLKKLGPEHPGVAIEYNNLGVAYSRKGDYDKAIEYCQKSLKINLKKLGPEHPSVAGGYNNLGMVYKSKGNYVKAIGCFQNSLKIVSKHLGPDHLHTKLVQENLNSVK